MRHFVGLLAAALTLSGASCAPNKALTDAQVREQIATLQSGRTTRTDVILRYGEPSLRLENDRLLTFRLVRTPDGRIASSMLRSDVGSGGVWGYTEYSLVTTYDDRGTLQEYNLVAVK